MRTFVRCSRHWLAAPGLNFVFDREVRNDIKVTLSVSNLSIDDVVGVLTATNQLERKRLNDNTVLIYPNTAAKQKDYVDLNVRTFYLANAEAKSIVTMLKTVLKTRDIYADDKLNSLTMRDTPDAIFARGKADRCPGPPGARSAAGRRGPGGQAVTDDRPGDRSARQAHRAEPGAEPGHGHCQCHRRRRPSRTTR